MIVTQIQNTTMPVSTPVSTQLSFFRARRANFNLNQKYSSEAVMLFLRILASETGWHEIYLQNFSISPVQNFNSSVELNSNRLCMNFQKIEYIGGWCVQIKSLSEDRVG